MTSFDRSFVEVVGEPCKTEEECIYVKKESVIKNARWLSNSLVVVVRWEGIILSISGLCEGCGIRGVKVARLRGRKVLLTFNNLEEALPPIQAFGFDFDQIFPQLEKWVPSRPPHSRIV